jgi:hypothetical protein
MKNVIWKIPGLFLVVVRLTATGQAGMPVLLESPTPPDEHAGEK